MMKIVDNTKIVQQNNIITLFVVVRNPSRHCKSARVGPIQPSNAFSLCGL